MVGLTQVPAVVMLHFAQLEGGRKVMEASDNDEEFKKQLRSFGLPESFDHHSFHGALRSQADYSAAGGVNELCAEMNGGPVALVSIFWIVG